MLLWSTKVEEARRGYGEDRISSVRGDGCTIFVIADGAGGASGGADAADAVCIALKDNATGESDWSAWLMRCDRAMATSASSGLTAAIVISISDDGVVSGASVGDCEAWVFGQGAPVELTVSQIRKPLLGDGMAVAIGFAGRLSSGTLVVASDGLWKYMTQGSVAEKASVRPIDQAVTALVDGVRLPSGALHDDVAVMLCELALVKSPGEPLCQASR